MMVRVRNEEENRMTTFDSGGVEINYIDEGEGAPIVLVHGFASFLEQNWRGSGIIDALKAAGRRVIALDCRGHGKSEKPHDPSAYEGTKMPDDVPALMDHLGIAKADIMGYSMGSFISASLIVRMPDRFHTAILGGVGDAILSGGLPDEGRSALLQAMDAGSVNDVAEPAAKLFRIFAEANGNDLKALAAMQRAETDRWFDPAALAHIRLPVAVIVGTEDVLMLPADRLVSAIPGARLVLVPGDHLTAPLKPEYRQAVLEFLAERSPVAA
jgi:pimeloyl-ACP methyl ester carboxylesterase